MERCDFNSKMLMQNPNISVAGWVRAPCQHVLNRIMKREPFALIYYCCNLMVYSFMVKHIVEVRGIEAIRVSAVTLALTARCMPADQLPEGPHQPQSQVPRYPSCRYVGD